MPKKVVIKTKKNTVSVSAYLNSIEPESARREAKILAKLFKNTTGAKPKMWGGSIIGYGEYTYYRANGAEGEMCATGFAIRKSGPVLYVISGYTQHQSLMAKLGPHKLGKSCLYLKNLDDVDLDVVKELIASGIDELKQSNSVRI